MCFDSDRCVVKLFILYHVFAYNSRADILIMPSTSAVGVELLIVQKFARISDATEIRINDWIARPTKLGHLVVLTRLKVTDQVLNYSFVL